MIRRATRVRYSYCLALALSALFVNSIFPIHSTQAVTLIPTVRAAVGPILVVKDPAAVITPVTVDPKPVAKPVVKRRLTIRVSAYSSTADQTDASPFTTASGARVKDGTFAMNCLPFGTKIRIPSKFGDKLFTVQDRMNAKWGCQRGDIWMATRNAAKQWGVRTVTIEILS